MALEERLGEVLQAVELRAAEERGRLQGREREARDRQAREQQAIELATARFLEEARVRALRTQVDAFEQALAIRTYCSALEDRYGCSADGGQWIAWARTYAERLDPLNGALKMPAMPEVRPEDLKPYLPVELRRRPDY